MVYSVSITSAGQVTIPKVFRDALKLGKKVDVEMRGDEVVIKREKTREEEVSQMFSDLEDILADVKLSDTKQFAGMTHSQVIDELEKTPEGRAAIEAEYGKGIYA